MKKLFATFAAALVLLGAGCADRIPLISDPEPETVSGNWVLVFDLPEGWVMVEDYSEPRTTPAFPSLDVTHDQPDVIIQSTSKAIVAGGIAPDASVDAATYVSSDFTQIRAFHLDERRIVPSEAEDLGDGWYRLKLCEDGEDCTIYGQHNYDYYYVTETAKYKFSITTNGQDVSDAVDVIQSAQEVTVFTDGPTVNATTE